MEDPDYYEYDPDQVGAAQQYQWATIPAFRPTRIVTFPSLLTTAFTAFNKNKLFSPFKIIQILIIN